MLALVSIGLGFSSLESDFLHLIQGEKKCLTELFCSVEITPHTKQAAIRAYFPPLVRKKYS